MARFWLGPIPWISDAFGDRYEAPAGTLGWIDLRSPVQCAIPNAAGSGFGFFTTANAANLGSSYTNLGTDIEASLTNQQRNSLASALTLPQTPASNVLGEIIYEAMTLQSDPTGEDRCLPLVPTTGRRFEIWLAGVKVRDKGFTQGGMEAASLQTLLQRQYRALYLNRDNDAPNLRRKVLGYWVRKFGIPYRWFQPNDLPDESDVVPTTTITESFVGADKAGVGYDLTWTEVSSTADWSNTSNSLKFLTGGLSSRGSVRAEFDLSSFDTYAQIVATTISGTLNFVGGIVRFASAANTYYIYYSGGAGSSPNFGNFSKVVASTRTDLGSVAGTQLANGHTIKSSISGSTLAGYVNGVSQGTKTDTAITTGTRCGVGDIANTANDLLNSFQAADLPVAGGLIVNSSMDGYSGFTNSSMEGW